MERNRREFLGLLSWILLTPAHLEQLTQKGTCSLYRGALRPLADRIAEKIKPGFRCNVLTLHETVEDSTKWFSSNFLSTLAEISGLSWEELSAELVARKICRFLHAAYFDPEPGPPEGYWVEMTSFETAVDCELAWKQTVLCAEEAGLVRCDGIGEEALVSEGEHAVGRKVCFVRGNVMASVLSFTSEEEVPRVALLLDRQIEALRS